MERTAGSSRVAPVGRMISVFAMTDSPERIHPRGGDWS
jgi:hypothetical protein